MYDGSQIALALNGEGQVTNRYLWGPAVDMLLADERANAAAGENAVRSALG